MVHWFHLPPLGKVGAPLDGKTKRVVWHFALFPFQTHSQSLDAYNFIILILQTLLIILITKIVTSYCWAPSSRKLSMATAWKKPTLLSSRNGRYSWIISQCSQWVLDRVSFCTSYYLILNSWSAQEIYCSVYCVSNGVCSSKQGWLTCPCIAWEWLALSWS